MVELQEHEQVEAIEGKKVKLTGVVEPGRFIIKRKRNDQDGYII